MPRYGGQWDKIFNNIWKKYNKSRNNTICKITPHTCRHTFATNMVIKGMEPIFLKKILGHNDIATIYKIYTHIKDCDTTDEMIRMGLIFKDKNPLHERILELYRPNV